MSWLFSCIGCGSKKVAEREETKILDFQHFSLTSVPPYAFECERFLEELYLDCNQISELPKELFLCSELQVLSLCDNDLHNIPPAVSSLTNLTSLDISKNGIGDIPDNIKGCKRLRTVNASTNPLCRLPEGFTQLVALRELSLSDTFLEYLPANFGRLTGLEVLELRENQLNTLPRSMTRLTALRRLDLGQNEFTELPEVLSHLSGLTDLWVDSNRIKRIPEDLGKLSNLSFLDASKNRLVEIEPGFGRCRNLSHLYLTRNELETLPDALCQCRGLSTLHVDDNHLSELPEDLGLLDNLVELKVSQNELSELPPSLGLLRNLGFLHVDENLLTGLPGEMGSCVSLVVVTAAHNQLSSLPAEMGSLLRLRVLNLCRNAIHNLPVSFSKLQLSALWLSANQAKPLVPLQCTTDAYGQKVLTCFMLPQSLTQGSPSPSWRAEDDRPPTEAEVEARRARSHIQFATDGDPKPGGRLSRVPTPYPKELRALAKHTKNIMALKKEREKGRGGGEPPVTPTAGVAVEASAVSKKEGDRPPVEPLPQESSSLITLKSKSSGVASTVKVAANVASESAIKTPTPEKGVQTPVQKEGNPLKSHKEAVAHLPSKENAFSPKEPSCAAKESINDAKEPTYVAKGSTFIAKEPTYGARDPSKNPSNSPKDITPSSSKVPFPSPKEPSYSFKEQPSYSPKEPTYPKQEPTYTKQEPTYTKQEPTYTKQEPTYPKQEPTYPKQETRPLRPTYSPQKEGYSVARLATTTTPSEATVKITPSEGSLLPLCQNGASTAAPAAPKAVSPSSNDVPQSLSQPVAPAVSSPSSASFSSSPSGGQASLAPDDSPMGSLRPASIAVADYNSVAPRGSYPLRPGSLALEGALPPWKNHRPGSLAAPINTVGIPMSSQAKRAVSQSALYRSPQETQFTLGGSPSPPGDSYQIGDHANGSYTGDPRGLESPPAHTSEQVKRLNEKNSRFTPGEPDDRNGEATGQTTGLVSIINQVTEDRSLSPGGRDERDSAAPSHAPEPSTKIPTFSSRVLSPQRPTPLMDYESRIPPPGQVKVSAPVATSPGVTSPTSKIPHFSSTPKGGQWRATSPEAEPSKGIPSGMLISKIPPPSSSPVVLAAKVEKTRTQIPTPGVILKGQPEPPQGIPGDATPSRDVVSPKGQSRIPTFASPTSPGDSKPPTREIKSPVEKTSSNSTPAHTQGQTQGQGHGKQGFLRSPSQIERESGIPVKKTPPKESPVVSPVEKPINQTGIPILAPREAEKTTRIPSGSSNSSLRGRKSQIPAANQRGIKYQPSDK